MFVVTECVGQEKNKIVGQTSCEETGGDVKRGDTRGNKHKSQPYSRRQPQGRFLDDCHRYYQKVIVQWIRMRGLAVLRAQNSYYSQRNTTAGGYGPRIASPVLPFLAKPFYYGRADPFAWFL